MANSFKADEEFETSGDGAGRAMSMCVMEGSMPWAIQGELFEGLPLLKGRNYFCNVPFAHRRRVHQEA